MIHSSDEIVDNNIRLHSNGKAPNLECPVCNGLGFVHPVDLRGNPMYAEVISCKAKGCLGE